MSDLDYQDTEHTPNGLAQIEVPVPSADDIAEHAARALLRGRYSDTADIKARAEKYLNAMIEKIVEEKARPMIEGLLAEPLQPTDGFGNPVGEKTTLHGLLAHHVTQWATVPVKADGRASKGSAYEKVAPRIDWMVGQIVSRDMKSAVDSEVKRLSDRMKGDAAKIIAQQIAGKIAATIFT